MVGHIHIMIIELLMKLDVILKNVGCTVTKMLDHNKKLCYAYSLKELFYEMMDSADSQTYALRFKRWQEDVLQHNLPQFIRLMNTMIEWKHEIVAAIETGYSNGYIEGCNNRTKVLKRTCYGLRNFERMRNRILYLAVTKNR